ncbi:MFS transporter [Phormidium tenue FACHB-886]|nr:MFS transporter [Phormidium tenue FACHB-886]
MAVNWLPFGNRLEAQAPLVSASIPVSSAVEPVLPEAVAESPLQLEAIAPAPLAPPPAKPPTKLSKPAIRQSLQASTWDGVFATLFSNITGGVLLTNFLMELGASPSEIGMLASIPMWANLLQPLGAHWADKMTSRHFYCLWIYTVSRSLWLILAFGVLAIQWSNPHTLVTWTLAIALLSYFLGALGSAPWLSWMAALVPRRLRGRYFGTRNSAANLVNLISIPLTGWLVAHWVGGSQQGFGLMLVLGVVFGLFSLWFQNFMTDINPQEQRSTVMLNEAALEDTAVDLGVAENQPEPALHSSAWIFLGFAAFWMFSVSLSGPFFNLYLLNDLKINLSQVSLYNCLTAAANLLTLLFWGKLADRIGNRPILIGVGIFAALTPVLWLVTDANSLSIWLWIPLLHLLTGGTWAALDLCNNNLQIGVAPPEKQAAYFGLVAAVVGASSALGTIVGGFLAESSLVGGLLGLFALSSALRLVALLPLMFVREQRSDFNAV